MIRIIKNENQRFSVFLFSGSQLTVYSLFTDRIDSVSWQGVYQFALSIGALFGPLLTKPFLLEIPEEPLRNNVTNATNTVTDSNIIFQPQPQDVTIMYAFLIVGAAIVFVGLVLILTNFLFGGITVAAREKKSPQDGATEGEGRSNSKGALWVAIVILLLLFYIFQSVYLRTFNNYLAPFAVNYLGWSKAEGADLTSAYFAAMMVGKIMIFGLVRVFSIEAILYSGLVLCNVGAVGLCFLLDVHVSIIWVFSSIISLGSCIAVSVLIAWTDKYIGIRGYVGIIYSVGGSIGEFAISPLFGFLFESVSYMWLMYLTLIATVTCSVLMITLQILGSQYQKRLQYQNL